MDRMPPAARIDDSHFCPMGAPPEAHVGGPILLPGEATVLIGFMPAARLSDICVCVGPFDAIVQGAPTVLIGNQPAARLGDATAHGGMIITGEPTVLIGTSGQGAALSAAADAGAAVCDQCGD
jgi:uncharacterized Zn-binding protein involved in type VI secretion